jgi:hypothetical protein
MSQFAQPIVQTVGRSYSLIKPYRYTWADGLRCRVTIPVPFKWDGASVPRLLWSVSGVRPGGPFLAASLVHDAFYRYGGRLPDRWFELQSRIPATGWWPHPPYTRKEADELFRRMLIEAGVGWWQYHRAYWAVRLFGRWAWRAAS